MKTSHLPDELFEGATIAALARHAAELKEVEAIRALARGGSCLLLDLESCLYLDSGGISLLLDTLRRVRPQGWPGVISPSPDALRILSNTALTLDPNFRAFASEEEARAALLAV